MAIAKVNGIDIKGIAVVLPANAESNSGLELLNETERTAIINHTGILNRRVAEENISAKLLFEKGIEQVLNRLDWQKESIDILICVTQTAEIAIPSVSNQLHGNLGFGEHVLCYDINSGCSGYVYGLHTVGTLLSTIQKVNARALFCCGDISSQLIERNDHATRPIFSDAISVTAIEASGSESSIFNLQTAGSGQKAIFSEKDASGKLIMKLNGIDVFNYTLKMVPQNITQLLDFGQQDISFPEMFVFHQANKLINDAVCKRLKIEMEKAPSTLFDYGNTASASIPLTLGLNKHQLTNGWVLLCGFGVGFSVASALIKIENDFHFNCIEV